MEQQRIIPDEKKRAQDEVDASLLEFFSQAENTLLKQYLKTRFSLRDRMYPHKLKF